MVRLLGLVATLLVLAYGAILADGALNARCGVSGHVRCTTDAFEAASEERQQDRPIAPVDVNDDDDDNDGQEVSTQEHRVVPNRGPVARRVAPSRETIRSSLGHPRGIDDPPRS